MLEGPKFGAGGTDLGGAFSDMAFYRKLGEGSISNMSIDSAATTTNGGGSVAAMSMENSSVGSTDSHTGILNHPGLRPVPAANYSVGHSVMRQGRVSHALTDDALAQALMDPRHPTETLEDYNDWAIDLRKLNMGMMFAQGAFEKLYRGTYNEEDIAIKLLERSENDPEWAQLMEQQLVFLMILMCYKASGGSVSFEVLVGYEFSLEASGGSVSLEASGGSVSQEGGGDPEASGEERKYDECIKDYDRAVERGRELRSNYKMVARALTRKGTTLAKLAKTSEDY